MTGLYHRPMDKAWWLKNPRYFKFMVRELTGVFIAVYLLSLLYFVTVIPNGSEATQAHLDRLSSPGWIAFHCVTLFFAVFHTVTWFNLTPKVMVVWRGEEKVPGWLLAGGNYVAWIAVSVAFVWFLTFLEG